MIRWTENARPGLPYWWDPARPDPDLADAPPARVDILIVGGGYTGLSAAIHAHDAGASVAVIDAGWPGQAASTRNGGMFGAHPRLGYDLLETQFGRDTADGVFNEAKGALETIRALIERENIDAEHQQTGRITLGWTKSHFENLKRVADQIRAKTDIAVEVLERDQLGREIETPLYFGGMVLPEHGGINPKKFHEGLLCSVLERGIPVVPDCAAQTWQRAHGGYIVETPKGTIRAEKLILGMGGYATRAFPWIRQRVFPLPSFIIATEPLDPDLIAKLAPGRRMMVETRARHSYYRISPDGTRILWGGRAAMRPIPLRKAAGRLYQTMTQVWPELDGVKISHAWTGNTGYSFTHMPWVGEDEGIHFSMGYSGSGTVMAPYLGAKAALQAVGSPEGETAFAATNLRPSWLNLTGTPWFLYAADAWYHQVVDRRGWSARRR